MATINISISALSSEPSYEHVKKAEELLDILLSLLEERECTPAFFIGGYTGLMKKAVDYILKSSPDSTIVAITPIEYEDLHTPEKLVIVKTGMSFQNRNPILVRSGDFLLALGGGSGTIMEIYNAIALGKDVVLLTKTGSPSDHFQKTFPDGKPDPFRDGRIFYCDLDNGMCRKTLTRIVTTYCRTT